MSDPSNLTGNAANREHVQYATRKTKDRRAGELSDLKAVLTETTGRRVLWRLLEHCSAFESIWAEGNRVHYNAGRQDIGHFLMAEIQEADPDALVRLMVEAGARKKRERAENIAAQTTAAT